MQLSEWVRKEWGRGTKLAQAMGVPSSFVAKLCDGTKAIPVTRASEIERLTDGEVSRRESRPTDWGLIWPELVTAEHPWPSPLLAEAAANDPQQVNPTPDVA
jgi:DNA-binding transcriptional regulator YdaS (Cro superfamily)